MIDQDVTESHAAFAALQKRWKELSRPINVLIVEDDKNDIELLKAVIVGHRVETKVALSASEAKAWLDQQEYDLCILDLKLPDAHGVDLLKWASKHGSPVPFIVLTGSGESDPKLKEALDAGAKCVFQKPLTPSDVKMILGAANDG